MLINELSKEMIKKYINKAMTNMRGGGINNNPNKRKEFIRKAENKMTMENKEEYSALMEAALKQKPLDFKKIFESHLKVKLVDLVAEKKDEMSKSLGVVKDK